MGRDTTAEKLEEDETHQEAGGAAGKAGGTQSASAGEQEALREVKQNMRPNVRNMPGLEQVIARGRREKRK